MSHHPDLVLNIVFGGEVMINRAWSLDRITAAPASEEPIPVNTVDELLGLIRLHGYHCEDRDTVSAARDMDSIKAALAGWKPVQS